MSVFDNSPINTRYVVVQDGEVGYGPTLELAKTNCPRFKPSAEHRIGHFAEKVAIHVTRLGELFWTPEVKLEWDNGEVW